MLTEAILDVLAGKPDEQLPQRMARASRSEWRRALRWMDTSGVALYFLHAMEIQELAFHLPDSVRKRLMVNREQNRERARDFARELRAIGQSFSEESIPFLVLKGFANIPEACPDPALRLQVDLDLMVKEQHTSQVQKVLQQHGYGLTAIGNGSWEFRTQSVAVPKLEDLYAVKPERSLDVHPVATAVFDEAYATRSERQVLGARFHALGAVERVVAQSVHLAKHLRGEWTRLSWLLEMQAALVHWKDHAEFWPELRSRLKDDASATESLGVALLLCRAVLRCQWENECLVEAEGSVPEGMKLWIAEYGREAVLRSFPGSKLYLLMPSANGGKNKERHRRLMPVSAPALIVPREVLDDFRLRAAWTQLRFLAFRARFHIREGARYLLAAPRWRRMLAQMEESR